MKINLRTNIKERWNIWNESLTKLLWNYAEEDPTPLNMTEKQVQVASLALNIKLKM